MICETHKPAYPKHLNDKIATSTENVEHKMGVSLFKRLKISSVQKSNSIRHKIRLEHILKETIQLCVTLSS